MNDLQRAILTALDPITPTTTDTAANFWDNVQFIAEVQRREADYAAEELRDKARSRAEVGE